MSSLPSPLRLTLLVAIGATVYVAWIAWREPEVRMRLGAARRRLGLAWPSSPRGTGLDT